MSKLYDPVKVGRMLLRQRIALAPMTRLRADENHVPLPSVKEYYAQRGSVPGTLLVTEATVISPRHGGYENVPGLYNSAQIQAWKEVTNAVHQKGSFIYAQLWALGRAGNPGYLRSSGHRLVSASDVPMKSAFSDEIHQPEPLTEEGIQDAISDFSMAAENAMAAGFDGVEIHGANGYLLDQFLQDVSNKRTDSWGGGIQNRSRFTTDVTRVVAKAIGNDRTAIRLSPFSRYQGMRMSDPFPQFTDLIKRLAELKLAYLHLCESDARDSSDSLQPLVEAYGNASPILFAGGYDGPSAERGVDMKYKNVDAVIAFGRPFIGNPDLAFKVKRRIPFTSFDPATMYAQSAEGYTDYQFCEEFQSSL